MNIKDRIIRLMSVRVPWAVLLAFAAAMVALYPEQVASAAAREPIAETQWGKLRGAVIDDVIVFKGVRYGKDTSAYRFRPPVPLDPWDGVRDALEYAKPCPQVPTPAVGVLATGFREKWPFEPNDLSEDCLAMKIITPALDDGKRPVMVWLHGGGYAHGSGMAPAYDGTNMVKHGDIVHVAINHRLNIFGYLYLADLLGDEFRDSGNVGMLDMIAALEWIQANIENFGGDPNNVTIFGQSGGGGKVSTLMAMPKAQGLFHKAIVESGSAITQMDIETAKRNAEALLDELGLSRDQASELLTMPMAELLNVVPPGNPRIQTTPVVDGHVLPRHPFEPDAPVASAHVPLLVGSTENESTYQFGNDESAFHMTRDDLLRRLNIGDEDRTERVVRQYEELYPELTPTDLYFLIAADANQLTRVLTQATRKAEQVAPVYVYHVTWKTRVDGGKWRSPHMLEVPFVFRTVREVPSLFEGDYERAERMEDILSPMWIQFARTGDPNVPGLPEWRPFTLEGKEVMVFDEESRTLTDPFAERLAILAGE